MNARVLQSLITRKPDLLKFLNAKQDEILHWLKQYEDTNELPFYSSVDIRDAGFKMAVVDTNIFPAGFNNLCEHGLSDASLLFKLAVQKRVDNVKNILIIAEEHTRNTWYLENVRILQKMIEKAGFNCVIATFLTVHPDFCETMNFVEVKTATGQSVQIYCLKNVLNEFKSGKRQIDFVILNNDLSTGIPDILKDSPIPIYPSVKAGWHSRLKSHHFTYAYELLTEFSNILSLDPWLFSALFNVAERVDMNQAGDRERIQDIASDLLQRIDHKYREHGIEEKPYLIMKADYGTYGMGVLAVEDPAKIPQLNRRGRSKLISGKGSRVNDRYLLQEGIPTIYAVDNEVSEVCMYQIENHLIGGFFRSHSGKGVRDNLNAAGMNFKKICPHNEEYQERDCLAGIQNEIDIFDMYRLLARIASVAAHREIIHLEERLP